MAITCTIITLEDTSGAWAEVRLRGDAFDCARSLRHLDRYIKAHNLTITGMVGYQQPTFYQSLHYHETGEVI